jgi:hypothetical protein
MNDLEVATCAPSNPGVEPESQRKEVVVIKIANGYVVSPSMYSGDIEKFYATDVEAALVLAKTFLG